MLRKVKLYAKVIPATDKRESFTAFSTKVGDEWWDVRFKRTCREVPCGAGTMVVATDKYHIQYQEGQKPPVVWVDDIASFAPSEVELIGEPVED